MTYDDFLRFTITLYDFIGMAMTCYGFMMSS